MPPDTSVAYCNVYHLATIIPYLPCGVM